LAFEIQELPDVIRIVILLNLSKGAKLKKTTLKNKIDHVCVSYTCVNMNELEKALKEMSVEGLITENDDWVQLTPKDRNWAKNGKVSS
jgi:hypothetical protein